MWAGRLRPVRDPLLIAIARALPHELLLVLYVAATTRRAAAYALRGACRPYATLPQPEHTHEPPKSS